MSKRRRFYNTLAPLWWIKGGGVYLADQFTDRAGTLYWPSRIGYWWSASVPGDWHEVYKLAIDAEKSPSVDPSFTQSGHLRLRFGFSLRCLHRP